MMLKLCETRFVQVYVCHYNLISHTCVGRFTENRMQSEQHKDFKTISIRNNKCRAQTQKSGNSDPVGLRG